MAFIRALVSIERDTSVPEDTVTNTLYFDSDSGNADDVWPEIHAELTTFYQSFDGYMPAELLAPLATVKYYDMADAEPRIPVGEDDITLTLGAGNPLPPEIAICMSFQGATGSGVNMRRRRGRLYLGPWLAAFSSSTGGRSIVDPALITQLDTAASNLINQTTTFGTKWAVFSPTTYAETSNLGTAFEDVVSGWIDNEWDIQRRRGTVAQSRTLFP